MRILIVEDSIKAIRGLRNLISDLNEDHIIVGEAINGIEGIELCKKMKPDLIISDVKMPDMDGISMMKYLREEERLDIKVIFLSGYAEFELAQSAIECGAYRYLIKPVNIEKLTGIIRELNKEIYNPIGRKNLLVEYIRDSLLLDGENKIKDNPKYKDLSRFMNDEIYMCFFYSNNFNDKIIRKIDRHIANSLYREKFYINLIILEQIGVISIILISKNENNTTFRYKEGYSLANEINTIINLEIDTIGYYCEYQLDEPCIQKIWKRIRWGLVLGNNNVLTDERILKYKNIAIDVQYPSKIINCINKHIFNLEYKNVSNKLNELYESFVLLKCTPEKLIDIIMNSYFTIVNTIKEQNRDAFKFLVVNKIIHRLENIYYWTDIQKINKLIEDSLIEKKFDIKCYSLIVNKFINIIKFRYMEDITLNKIANELGITQEYLCTSIKKETGISFVNYLNNIRIENACKIILNSDKKFNQIYQEVGFNDINYFYRVFKKVTGYTTKEYLAVFKSKEI